MHFHYVWNTCVRPNLLKTWSCCTWLWLGPRICGSHVNWKWKHEELLATGLSGEVHYRWDVSSMKLLEVGFYLLDPLNIVATNCIPLSVRETFEPNQLKSASSQLLLAFSGFDQLQTCCHWFGPANILYYFQVPANFFFIVMTTGQELGHWYVSKFSNVAKLWNVIVKQKLRMFAIHQTATSL